MQDNYRVLYRKIKYPRLEFRTGKLHVILPMDAKPEPILAKHKNWIKKNESFIKETLLKAQNKRLVKRPAEKFKKLVYDLVKINTRYLSTKINKIYFRKMRTKWASLSPQKNLTINTLMVYLPSHLIDYIIYHELSHVYEKTHNKNFWRVITKRFANYQLLERELFVFWFLIHKTNV